MMLEFSFNGTDYGVSFRSNSMCMYPTLYRMNAAGEWRYVQESRTGYNGYCVHEMAIGLIGEYPELEARFDGLTAEDMGCCIELCCDCGCND